MDRLMRLVLVRHGETTGRSSIRYFGATDVPLSASGREQVAAAKQQIHVESLEMIWASSLSRAWQGAQILAPGRSVQLESGFREIDFGRWEGLTREEIEALDPELYSAWQADPLGFDYPEGEARSAFRDRVANGLARLRASGTDSALVVAHKGVVRTLTELLTQDALPPEEPELGGVVHLFCEDRGTQRWRRHKKPGTSSG